MNANEDARGAGRLLSLSVASLAEDEQLILPVEAFLESLSIEELFTHTIHRFKIVYRLLCASD